MIHLAGFSRFFSDLVPMSGLDLTQSITTLQDCSDLNNSHSPLDRLKQIFFKMEIIRSDSAPTSSRDSK
jgi:hypothetical protein